MEHTGPYTLQSLDDARSKVCGFRISETEDAIELSAEWSHSLNMLDIDISSIYQEVCATMTQETSDKMGGVDVVVSCDKTKVFIAFLGNLRNRTGYKCMDDISMFYGMEGHPLSGLVVDACVWKNIMHDGVQVLLHVDKGSTSCWFRFREMHDHSNHSSFLRFIKDTVLYLAILALVLWVVPLGLVWRPIGAAICLYVLPIFNPQLQNLAYCRGLVDSIHNDG